MCRSRRELSNEDVLAKIGIDTAENEPLEVWGKIVQNSIHYSVASWNATQFEVVAPTHKLRQFLTPHDLH